MTWMVKLALCFGLAMIPAIQVAASGGEAVQRLKQLNKAGTRGLLVQHMATCSCMTMLGDANHRKTGELAISAFEGSLVSSKNPDLGVHNGAPHADMIAIWPDIRSALNQLLQGDHHSIVAHQLFEGTDELLERTQIIEDALVSDLPDDLDQEQGRLLRLMSDQRMLGKRMMKQACFIMAGLRETRYSNELMMAMDQYQAGLSRLLNGDPIDQTPAISDAALRAKIKAVEALWIPFRSDLETVVKDASTGQVFASEMMNKSDALLKEISAAISHLLKG